MAWTKTKSATAFGMSLMAVVAIIAVVKIFSPRDSIRKKVKPEPRELEQARQASDVRAAERKLEAARIKSRTENDETVSATTIDLRPYINVKLTEAPMCWKGNNANNLADLPEGKHIYAGVPFDVAGSIQLMGGWLKHYKKTYPTQVSDIRIDRSCAKLHLLHANGFITYTNFGTTVSKLVLHYDDNSTREINLVAGEQSFDMWFPLFKSGLAEKIFKMAPGTERAWTGSNEYIRQWQPELSVILYKSTLENPQPDIKLSSVDFVSAETITCPFLVGLTVE